MRFKIAAGAEIDTLTRGELADELAKANASWRREVSRGDRYRRISAHADISAGTLTIGGPDQAGVMLGPADGFVWAVQRVAITGPAWTATETLALHLNDTGPSATVHPAVQSYQSFGQYDLVLYPGDTLLFTGTGLASTGTVTVTGQVRELPLPLAWRIGS